MKIYMLCIRVAIFSRTDDIHGRHRISLFLQKDDKHVRLVCGWKMKNLILKSTTEAEPVN